MSQDVYDKKYFQGPTGVYYYAVTDKIYWLKESEEMQFYNKRTKKLIRHIAYDFETADGKYKQVLMKNPGKGHFVRLGEP